MDTSNDSHKEDEFYFLGHVPVTKVPDFVEFNTVYEFRGSEHITFKIEKVTDHMIKVMYLGDRKMSAIPLIDSVDSDNTTVVKERTN